jgi:hypothetical protein
VQPGETGRIPIKIRSGKLSSKIAKTITVNTNIPGEGALVRIKMRGEVWQPVQFTPRTASFPRLTPEEAQKTATRKLTIVNNMDTPAELTDVTSNNPVFSAVVRVIEPGKKFELVVSTNPPLKPGRNNGKITIKTGVPEQPVIEITAYANVKPPVEVIPAKLSLNRQRTETQTRSFTVRSNTGKPIQISDLAVSNPALKVTLGESKPGAKTYRISLEVPADYRVAATGDRITFKTDCPTVPEIIVPITERPIPKRSARAGPAGSSRQLLAPIARTSKSPGGKLSVRPARQVPDMPTEPITTSDLKASIKTAPKKPKPADDKTSGQ